MKLKLKLVSPTGVEIEQVLLDQNSATLGRNEDNTLVLSDPQKYISGHHALIDFRFPDYFITDTSVNGVFINDAKKAVGNGNRVPLKSGDRLKIGDYVVDVLIVEVQAQKPETDAQASLNQVIDFPDDPFAELGTDDPVQEMIDENQLIPADWAGQGEDSDPFNFPEIDPFDPLPKEQINESKAEVKQPPAHKEAFNLVDSVEKETQSVTENVIPDDWFANDLKENQKSDDLFPEDFWEQQDSAASSTDSNPATQQSDEVINHVDISEGNKGWTDKNDLYETSLENFLNGAGLNNTEMAETLTPESFLIIGKILRTSIQGTLDVLIGRAKIKNEMHLDATMIRSAQNNPIKFSVTAEEALIKLLSAQGTVYLTAEEAIEEVFDDIRAHQFSVITGMQTALFELLKKFDPDEFEQQLKKQSPVSAGIPVHKQATLWRLFKRVYDEIEREAADDFYHLFGQAFAEAYQQQINQLKKAKKASPF